MTVCSPITSVIKKMFPPSAPSTGKVVGQSGCPSVWFIRLSGGLWIQVDGPINQPDHRSILSAWPPVLKLLFYCFWSMLPSSCHSVFNWILQIFQKIVFCRLLKCLHHLLSFLSTGISHIIVSNLVFCMVLLLQVWFCFPILPWFFSIPLSWQIDVFKNCS